MVFNPRSKLDPGQVTDRRGMGGRGGMAIGGGGIGIVVLLIYMFLGGDPAQLPSGGNPGGNAGVVTGPGSSQLAEECETGADANERQDCRIVGFVNSIQDYWTDAYAAEGGRYEAADTVLFDGSVDTQCGSATSAVGPFYCPLDKQIYLDLGFYEQLQSRFGAEGGPLAEGYVVAHEYGHHIQNLEGTLRGGSGEAGAEGQAVRTELQADCYAGVWAHHGESTGYLRQLTQNDIEQALSAAEAVGDDRIQEQVQGQVTPETWTHGSSEQRQKWFLIGYESGRPADCDTFSGEI
jgi:predicted metalloprotease